MNITQKTGSTYETFMQLEAPEFSLTKAGIENKAEGSTKTSPIIDDLRRSLEIVGTLNDFISNISNSAGIAAIYSNQELQLEQHELTKEACEVVMQFMENIYKRLQVYGEGEINQGNFQGAIPALEQKNKIAQVCASLLKDSAIASLIQKRAELCSDDKQIRDYIERAQEKIEQLREENRALPTEDRCDKNFRKLHRYSLFLEDQDNFYNGNTTNHKYLDFVEGLLAGDNLTRDQVKSVSKYIKLSEQLKVNKGDQAIIKEMESLQSQVPNQTVLFVRRGLEDPLFQKSIRNDRKLANEDFQALQRCLNSGIEVVTTSEIFSEQKVVFFNDIINNLKETVQKSQKNLDTFFANASKEYLEIDDLQGAKDYVKLRQQLAEAMSLYASQDIVNAPK